jgi:hypothetical protein
MTDHQEVEELAVVTLGSDCTGLYESPLRNLELGLQSGQGNHYGLLWLIRRRLHCINQTCQAPKFKN